MDEAKKIAEKWKKRWQEAKLFEANPIKGKQKYFVTFPYPYINLFPHIGHFYSLMRVEAFARYKRMQGFNVLYPQGWHATGSPMVNAALRVEEGEEKQIKTLKEMGFADDEIKKFVDPMHWIKVFGAGWQEDLTNAGISIDWRRNFITTSLNPHYNKFVEWQFRTLKERGYIAKGKKPVIWCEKCNQAIGDHARVSGEGETPQEYTIIKLRFGDSFIGCASLRPETVFGQTNIWVDPKGEYAKIRVNDKEQWIVSRQCAEKLKLQDKKIEHVGTIKGSEMLGKYCHAPGVDRDVIILPSSFCDPNIGTGIVTSVPSDAPDDYIGLRDLWENKELCDRYGLKWEEIKSIKIIPIIKTEEWGDQAAVKIVNDYKIKNQQERAKLEKARKVVYKAGYHTGIMNENCGEYSGLRVEEAKEKMKRWLLDNKLADLMYEPTGKVVCRCLGVAKVKIVSDQWFLNYGDAAWKKLAHECLSNMTLYPEKARAQFDYVIDWLNDWACTHESKTELGTHLPWDKQWVIESLSDSTIYMAYYTIAHKIKDIDINKIDDGFFNYVLLGKGSKPDINGIDELKAEFEYWYPMDLRSSGKDLIQNHLAFSIFNHTGIFPKEHWPQGFSVNGWVTVDGNKMSKSLGNVIPVRKMIAEFGADASRFTVLNGGEGMDDANWDSELAKSMSLKMVQLLEFCKDNYGQGIGERRAIDDWMESQLNTIIKDSTEAMEQMMFRSALQLNYFELQRAIRWYLRRAIKPNKEIMKQTIKTQALLLAPFTPFVCEEIWEAAGNKGFVSVAQWPKSDGSKINPDFEKGEAMIRQTLDDINSVLKLAKLENPQQIMLFVAEPWKHKLYCKLKPELEKTRDFKALMDSVMKDAQLKEHGKEITKTIQAVVKSGKVIEEPLSQEVELRVLQESKGFLEREYKCKIVVEKASDSKEAKARQAMPGRPAILLK